MSVLIKGMELPKSCMACPLYYYDQDSEHDVTRRCTVLDHAEILPSYMERRDDCPLVEVPTPHGDLIDKDKLNVHNYWYDKPKNGKTHFAFVYNGDIKKVEVVIGAEEET